MGKAHLFDLHSDFAYDPNSMPDIYLSPQQVQMAASQIICSDTKDQDALHLAVSVEELQREKCEGKIQPTEKSKKTRALHEAFRKKYGSWAFTSQAYKDFYSFFGAKDQ